MSDVKSYYTVPTSTVSVWISDREIAYLNNAGGVAQIWKTDIYDTDPIQLTFGKERILRLMPARDHKDLLFASDLGGNEQEQIFIYKEGGEVINLTDDKSSRYYLGGTDKDGKYVYFSCNRRCKASFDICKMDIESRNIETVLENSDNYNLPAAVSPDGVYMLYNKLKGISDNKMYIINMYTGETRDIDPSVSYAQYATPAWKSDSTGFYLTCDAGSEFIYAAYYDVISGRLEKIYDTDWDVTDLALSSDDRYLAMVVDEDGYGSLRIWDTVRNSLISVPRPPEGSIVTYYSMSWSPDGHRLMFNFSSGSRPSEIWVLDIDEDSLRAVVKSPLGDIDPNELVEPELRDFHSFDGLRVPYWYYRSPHRTPGLGAVVIEIHGGPEGQEGPSFDPLIQYLVSQGFDVAAPNVRGSTGYGKTYHHLDDVEKRLDSVHDAAALAEHLAEEGIADPKRIAVMGASYGGYMTLSCIANYPDLWAAAVDTVGMSDLETFLENTAEYRRSHRESEYGTLEHDRDTLRRVSPIHKVDQISTPLMVIHGANDPRVPITEAEQIVKSLRDRGVPVKFLRYGDEGHGLSKLKNRLDCYPQVVGFLKQNLLFDGQKEESRRDGQDNI